MATGHSLGASMAMIAAYNISFWTEVFLWDFGKKGSNRVYSDGLLLRTPFWKKIEKKQTPAQVVLSVLHLETLGILRTLNIGKVPAVEGGS